MSHAVVIGDGKPFISALIELDSDMTRSWLSQQGLDADMSMKQVAENDAVRAFVQQYVEKANANVSRAESVRKFEILDEEFNQQDGTLTASLKVVRPKVLQRYADVIENVIYAPKTLQQAVAEDRPDSRPHHRNRQAGVGKHAAGF